ncbi:MAG: 2-dehydropantoate 2-reductase [Neptuniibacter sp.]
MNIAILGAGGIGCFYGAKLQAAGNPVTYIGRGEHLSALKSNGLTVQHSHFSFHKRVHAVDLSQWIKHTSCDDYDLIIFAFKSTETEKILSDIAEWLTKGKCPVLSLQNGVDNEKLIADVIGEDRTLGGLAVRIGAHISRPGHINATGQAQVIFGQWPECTDESLSSIPLKILNLLTSAKIDATLSGNIELELWRKLMINNGVNPLSALTGLNTKQLTSNPQYSGTVYKLMEETARAASYHNINFSKREIDEMFELISKFDAIKTSMLIDYETGGSLELDAICGAVIKRCKFLEKPAISTESINSALKLKCQTSNFEITNQ